MKIGDLVFLKYEHTNIILKIKIFTTNTSLSKNKYTFYGTVLWDNEKEHTIWPPLKNLNSFSHYKSYSIYNKGTEIKDILFIEEL